MHVRIEDKSDDWNYSFCEELKQIFDQFPKYTVEILSGDFSVKLGRGDIFKPSAGDESVLENGNDNGVRVVNFATYKNKVAKAQCSQSKHS